MTDLMPTSGGFLGGWRLCGLAMLLLLAGCSKPVSPIAKTPKPAQKKPVPETPVADKQAAPKSTFPVPPAEEEQPATQAPRTEGTLTDLVNQAAAAEFRIPEINEAKVAAAGVRKLSGRHITIYTDLPAA